MNNNCVFVGRITKDLELKETKQNGIKYVEFSLAVDNGKDKDGNKREATFPNFRAWDKKAETMAKFLHKGSLVMVNSSYSIEKWQNDKGENRYTHVFNVNNFMFLDSKPKDNHEPEVPDYLTKTPEETIASVVNSSDPFEEMNKQVQMDTARNENGSSLELPF